MLEPVRHAFNAQKRSAYVRSFIEKSNIEVMCRIAPVICGLFAIALVSTFFSLGGMWSDRTPEMLVTYRVTFASLMVAGGCFGMLGRRYLRTAQPRRGLSDVYVMLFVILVLGASLWITLLDYATMGRYFFLLVALFTLFGLFFIPPSHTLLCEVVVFVIAYVGLQAMGLVSPVQMTILASYLLAILVVSAANYLARVRTGLDNEQIVNAARHDELTGALNRRALDEDARSYEGQDVHLLMIDVDGFKYFNDLYGHHAGDELLVLFYGVLSDCFGSERTYRYSSDEFVVLVTNEETDALRDRVEDVRARFHNSTQSEEGYSVTCSVGCVRGCVGQPDELFDLVHVADLLLMRSKSNGRNQATYATYDDGLMREAITRGGLDSQRNDERDPLTGLMGKDLFVERATELTQALIKRGASVSFVYINVSNLKDFNARYGFGRGDELLKFVANTLQNDVFPHKLLSRFSDDRFVLMTEDEGLSEALERACSIVRNAYSSKIIMLRAGVCRYVDSEMEVRYACDCARIACESLRGQYNVVYRYFTRELGERMERRNLVLGSFMEALNNGYIQPFYQPIIRTTSDLMCECEVLSRWIDPVRGMLPPDSFIPALEDAHLIHLLDLHIVEEVCKNYHKFAERGLGAFPVSVNFSRMDFEACDVVSEVVALLDRYDVPRWVLRAEVTESALAEDASHVQCAVRRFREQGIQVWMDDFGSGYSALNVLREYEFDLVKFDMNFVRQLNVHDPSDPSGIMLTNLVTMTKELGLQTLIEGVESVDQLLYLRNLSLSKIQGYVFGKPCSFDELCDKMADWTYVPEELQKRTYYDKIDRVDLMHPVDPASSFDPLGMAQGLPAAVFELQEDATIRYLEHNTAFERLLGSMDVESDLASEVLINARVAQGWKGYEKVVALLRTSDGWVKADALFDKRVKGYARCVAHVPSTDVMAVLIFAVPLTA